ncbi:MAG TPA: hypothetical protein VNO20_07570 [Solirubrobacterales bacterium]|nr:hypothetical protein [Solirubrobacterales bacterium]
MKSAFEKKFLPTVIVAFLIALVACAPASARKTRLVVETFGSAAQPTFTNSNALAVDPTSGDLLVVDTRNGFFKGTINRYHADGTPSPFSALGTNEIDAKGGGQCPTVPADCDQTPQNGFPFLGGFPGDQQVVIDDSGTVTDGNIYVTYSDVSGSTPGFADRIAIFAADGHYLGQLTEADGTPLKDVCGVAVGPGGNLYLAESREAVEVEIEGKPAFENPEGRIHKFDPSANPPIGADHVATFSTPDVVCGLATGAGSLFAAPGGNGERDQKGVLKLDASSGSIKGVVTEAERRMVSVDPVSGHVFVGGSNADTVEFDAAGSVPLATIGESTGIAGNGAIDRVYVSSGSEGPKPIRVRGPIVTVPEATTEGHEIEGDTSVRIEGTVNPDGQALTECTFEYGPTTAYGQTTPCEAPSAAEVGSGSGSVAVHADLAGLSGETLYHYRLVARNANAALYPLDSTGTARGSDQTFQTPGKPAIKGLWAADVTTTDALLKATVNPENSPTTYRFEWGADSSYGNSSAEFDLGTDATDRTVGFPLGELQPATTYHWRLVAENGLGVTEGPDRTFRTFAVPAPSETDCENASFRTGLAVFLPDCRAYEMVSPVDKDGGDIRVLGNSAGEPAVLEQGSLSGDGLAYGSVRAFGDAVSAPWTSQYIAERIAGSEWRSHAISSPQGTPIGVVGEGDTEFQAFSGDLCQAWLTPFRRDMPLAEGALSGYQNLYLRRDRICGAETYQPLAPIVAPPGLDADDFFANLEGVSSDGSRVIFTTNGKLAVAGTVGVTQLYESVEGAAPNFVCVLPDGKTHKGNCAAGSLAQGGAGDRIAALDAISSDGERIFWSGGGKLYVRVAAAQTLALSKAAEEAEGTSISQYWGMTEDGSEAIFTTGNSSSGEAALYGFTLEGEVTAKIADGVYGVMGVSDDADRIYFVSNEVLAPGATAGKLNLYLYEAGGSTAFIATVATTDLAGFGVTTQANRATTARVSPDAAYAAFSSAAPLTGYDNAEGDGTSCSGGLCRQVYRYDAAAGELLCVSCNPSGARPTGASSIPSYQTPMYAARVLSTDGSRLFFESADSLTPRDTNGRIDVYQWERLGTGSCEEGDSAFSAAAEGCIELISTGQSPQDSRFVEASPSGRDVFIAIGSSLLPQDPGGFDIYDARAGGGLPIPTGPPPACEGEACQPALEAPSDPTPASSSFQGAGNVTEAPKARRCPSGKRKVRRKGKVRCVPRKRASHGRRAVR